MSITFREVPSSTRIPGRYIELNTRLGAQGLPAAEAVVVICGQKTSAGSATAAEAVQVLSADEAIDLFGAGSMCHRMVAAALEANPGMAELWVVPLADHGSGVAASGTVTITVSGLEAGTLKVWIGDELVEVTVGASDTQNAIAAALKAAIDDLPNLPVTATVSTNAVTITAKNKGTLGNDIDIEAEYSGSGLTATIVAMASGATDPDAQTALDAIYAQALDIIVFPWNNATDLGELAEHLVDRSDGIEQRGAVGVSAMDDTVSNITTVSSDAGLNSGRVSIAGIEGSRTWAPEIAAAYAAAVAGEPDLARPLNGVVLKGVHAPEIASRFTRAEQTTLLANGAAPLVVASEKVTIGRSITTYMTNAQGAPDTALLDLQTIRVLDYLRRALKVRLDARFSQVKIAEVAHTENTTDASKIRAEILDVLFALERVDYLENVDDNKDGVVVERNADDPTRVDCVIPADVVNGLHVLAARIDLIL